MYSAGGVHHFERWTTIPSLKANSERGMASLVSRQRDHTFETSTENALVCLVMLRPHSFNIARKTKREGAGAGQGGGASSHRSTVDAYSPGLGQLGTPGLGPHIIVTPPTIGHPHVLRESSPLLDTSSPRLSDLDHHLFLQRGYPADSRMPRCSMGDLPPDCIT